MKILTGPQIREADAYTIKHEPIASIDLMERASNAFVKKFTKFFDVDRPVLIVCGPGNNGGDGLAISRLLLQKGYQVQTVIIRFTDSFSEDFKVNHERLKQTEKSNILSIDSEDQFPPIPHKAIIIDAIFGTGLSRKAEGLPAEAIHWMNSADATRVAVDMPSGMFADQSNTEDDIIFRADFTFTFQVPKLSQLLPQNGKFTGRLHTLDIGLSEEYLQQAETKKYFTTHEEILPLLKRRNPFDYKNTFGHSLIVAGSYGKIGAAILTANACLRAGAGLVTAYVPKCGYIPFQVKLPEIMVETGDHEKCITSAPALKNFTTIGVGPGLGTHRLTQQAFLKLIKSIKFPIVIDADGLNILAENLDWLKHLPENSILTPHPGEFKRLFGESTNDFDRLEKLHKAAVSNKLVIVLKTGRTAIASPVGNLYFNSTGNPGLGTAGSGDVLTGFITGLLSQGYSPTEAAKIGVFVHGLAGDLVAEKLGEEPLIAGDIITYWPKAWKSLQKKKGY